MEQTRFRRHETAPCVRSYSDTPWRRTARRSRQPRAPRPRSRCPRAPPVPRRASRPDQPNAAAESGRRGGRAAEERELSAARDVEAAVIGLSGTRSRHRANEEEDEDAEARECLQHLPSVSIAPRRPAAYVDPAAASIAAPAGLATLTRIRNS